MNSIVLDPNLLPIILAYFAISFFYGVLYIAGISLGNDQPFSTKRKTLKHIGIFLYILFFGVTTLVVMIVFYVPVKAVYKFAKSPW